MAFNSQSTYNQAIMGIPQVGGNADIYVSNATPQWAVGTLMERADGSRYRYGVFGADTTQGKVVAYLEAETAEAVDKITVVAPASANTTTDGSYGYSFIEGTMVGVTADSYAGGYLTVSNNTGEGFCYRIKGNTATGAPVANNFRIEIWGKLQATLAANSDVVITGCKWNNLRTATPGENAASVASGVSICNVDVSERPYAWVQTRGITSVLQHGTVALGDPVVASTRTAGAIARWDTITANPNPIGSPIGVARGVDVDTGYCTVDLRVE